MKNQINETQSRNLVRFMVLTSWLSFLASSWMWAVVPNSSNNYGWFAIFWLFIIIVLAVFLAAKEKK